MIKKCGFSQSDREYILQMVNIAERNGIATVKKGMKTRLLEVVDMAMGMFSKLRQPKLMSKSKEEKKNSNLLDMNKLNEACARIIERDRMNVQLKAKVNEQYAQTQVEEKSSISEEVMQEMK